MFLLIGDTAFAAGVRAGGRALDVPPAAQFMARVERMADAPRTLALAGALLALLAGAVPVAAGEAPPDPVPILPGARIFLPGPRGLGYQGLGVDPSTIGDFRGVAALAYLEARVRDAGGRRWIMANDIRVFQGDYVAADGVLRQGAFAFV